MGKIPPGPEFGIGRQNGQDDVARLIKSTRQATAREIFGELDERVECDDWGRLTINFAGEAGYERYKKQYLKD